MQRVKKTYVETNSLKTVLVLIFKSMLLILEIYYNINISSSSLFTCILYWKNFGYAANTGLLSDCVLKWPKNL